MLDKITSSRTTSSSSTANVLAPLRKQPRARVGRRQPARCTRADHHTRRPRAQMHQVEASRTSSVFRRSTHRFLGIAPWARQNGLRAAGFRLGATSLRYPRGLGRQRRTGCRGLSSDVEVLLFADRRRGRAARCARVRAGSRSCAADRAQLIRSTRRSPRASRTADEARAHSVGRARVLRAIDAARVFSPELFVVHVYFGDGERDRSPPRDAAAFRTRAARSLAAILERGRSTGALCVELLDYDFTLIEPVIAELGSRSRSTSATSSATGTTRSPGSTGCCRGPRRSSGTAPSRAAAITVRCATIPRRRRWRCSKRCSCATIAACSRSRSSTPPTLHESLALVHGWLSRLGAAPCSRRGSAR